MKFHIDYLTVLLWAFAVFLVLATPTLFYKEVYYLVGMQ